jgi:hypothetical protein
MPLLIKLVGTRYEIVDNYVGPLTLGMLEGIFELWTIPKEDFGKLMIITDSERIKSYDKEYMVNDKETRQIFITATDITLKAKLVSVFEKNCTGETLQHQKGNDSEPKQIEPDADICKPLKEEVKEPEPELTNEHVMAINKKTVELFSDPDFKYLIKIYLTKPELFSRLAQFTCKGNMVEIKTEHNSSTYTDEFETIKEFGLNVTDDLIMEKLKQFNGHLNLTLRALLCDI